MYITQIPVGALFCNSRNRAEKTSIIGFMFFSIIYSTLGYGEGQDGSPPNSPLLDSTEASAYMCTYKPGGAMKYDRTELFARYTSGEEVAKEEFVSWLSEVNPLFSNIQCFSMHYGEQVGGHKLESDASEAALSEHMAIEFALGNLPQMESSIQTVQLTDTAYGRVYRDGMNREVAIGFSGNLIMSEGNGSTRKKSSPPGLLSYLSSRAMASIVDPCLGCMKHYAIEVPWGWTTWLAQKTLPVFIYQRVHLVLSSIWYGPEMENTYQLKLHDK